MADDDDVIYVDIEARLNEGAARKETDKLKEQVKSAGKVDIEPTLDEPAADRAAGRLKDRLKNAGDAIGDALGDNLDKATDKASDKAADKFRKRLDGLQDTLGEALGKELGGLFGDGDGFGSHIGEALKGQLGSVTELFSGKGLELGNLPGMFDELRGGLREAAEGFRTLIPEGSRAAGALGAVADAAGPLAAVLLGIGSVYSGLQDILHSPTRLDTSPGALGLKPTLPQDITQTPANLMPLPGGTQPVQLPPGIKPGTQYQATPGSLDPFSALLPPGVKPPAGATDPNKPATPIIPSNPLIPSIAPPDMPDHTGTRSAFTGGGVVHATLVDFTTPSVSSPSDIPGAAGGVRNLYAVAESLAGTPYSQALRNDCSGMVSQIAAAALGLPAPSAGQRFNTTNEGAWLAGHGFQQGMGGPGDLSIGWYDHGGGNAGHTAATLPGGVNAESGGSAGAFTLGSGAAGASSPQFDHHMYLPMGGGGFGMRQAGFGTPGGGLLGPLPPPTQPNQSGGPKSQTPLGTGSGGGISGGGIIGAAEQAGVAAAGIAGFGGGAIAAQMAEQEINLAVQKGTQMGAALAAAPFETFGLAGGQMGAPSVNVMGGWPGKIISGLLGQQNQLPNIAAGAQPPKDPKQKDPNQPDQDPNEQQNQGPSGSKDDPMHVNVTNQPQTPQGGVTSAANMTATMAPLTA